MAEVLTPPSDISSSPPPHRASPLLTLPAELIDHILTYVSPLDLVSLSSACRLMNEHSHNDTLWQPHVWSNLPHPLSSPAPYQSFRALYTAHYPYWFLTKHQLWFADTPHTGKLLLARYSPTRACIEAYSLNAERGAHTFQFWEHNREVIIHTFHPTVTLDFNAPIVRLDASAYMRAELHRKEAASEYDSTSGGFSAPSKLQQEIPMSTYPSTRVTGSGAALYSQFMLTRPVPNYLVSRGTAVWPPLIIPSLGEGGGERTRNESVQLYNGISHKPELLEEASQTSWRLRRWMEFRGRGVEVPQMRLQRNNVGDMVPTMRASELGPQIDTRVANGVGLHPAASLNGRGGISLRVGEDVTTFATLDKRCYTPTASRPWRGIWVGDYSGHGCEFLVVLQPDEEEIRSGKRRLPVGATTLIQEMEERDRWRRNQELLPTQINGNGEPTTEGLMAQQVHGGDEVLASDSAYHIGMQTPHMPDEEDPLLELLPADLDENRQRLTNPDEIESSDDGVYRGRIEAVKLTGDPNVPRGEYTFIAPDIGPAGLVRVATEEIFRGARVVRSVGHIAGRGFREDGYTPSQLILVSHDTLAQYWEAFGHVSFYKRVDFEPFLKTD